MRDLAGKAEPARRLVPPGEVLAAVPERAP
jgi:hypothetical protein